jgi:hypothetical protein
METDEEVVRRNRRYAVRPETGHGEMLEVPGDDERSLAGDRGRDNVPVVGIGQGEAGDQILVAGDFGSRQHGLHEVACTLKPFERRSG